MAFVFRSQSSTSISQKTPGPAHYRPQVKEKSLPRPAPFNQSSPRNLWQQNVVPGPGTYPPETVDKDKPILQSGGRVFTVKTMAETSMFKSGLLRFKVQNEKEDSPGPGKYIFDRVREHRQQPCSQQTNLQKYLHNMHYQKSAHSSEALGTLAEEEEIRFDQRKSGDGVDGFVRKDLKKRQVPFYSSVERSGKERPKTSLGPGSYDIDPLKAQETTDPKELASRKKASRSLAKFRRMEPAPPEEAEYIDLEPMFKAAKPRETYAAGIKNFNQRKEDFFGSTVSRFLKTQTTATPGPGNYDSLVDPCAKVSIAKKGAVSFGRYSKPSNSQANIVVSPFSCEPPPDKSPPKQADSKNGCSFGSNQPRFRQLRPGKEEGSDSQQLQIGTGMGMGTQNNRENRRRVHKQLKPERAQPRKDPVDQRPLFYATQANTIEQKVGLKYQKNAPFSSQVTRFQEVQPIPFDQLLPQNQRQSCQEVVRERKCKTACRKQSRGLMDSQRPRFQGGPMQNVLSPCTYDPQVLVRKEFNRLFV